MRFHSLQDQFSTKMRIILAYTIFSGLFFITTLCQRVEYDCKLRPGCHVQCDPNDDDFANKENPQYPLRCRLPGEEDNTIPIKLFQDNKARLSELSKRMAQISEDRIKWEKVTEKLNSENGNTTIGSEMEEIDRLTQRIIGIENAHAKSSTDMQKLQDQYDSQNIKIEKLEAENLDLWREVMKLKSNAEESKKGPCEYQDGKRCYWIYVEQAWKVTLKDGESICRSGAGKIATIPNLKIYNEIVKYLRKNTPNRADESFVWVAMTYDPMTAVSSPSDAFYSWKRGFPKNGQFNRLRTNVSIKVYKFILDGTEPEEDTGMINQAPDWQMNGVICERLNS